MRLGDLLEIQNGFAFDSKSFNAMNGMPLVRIRDLKRGTETETKFSGDYDEKYVVKAGDLLIGMDGEFGCYEWKGEPSLLNQRVCRLQGFKSNLLPRFLFYGVNSHLKAIEDVTGYTTVKHLSSKQILGIDFPHPPLPEQKRIVGILDEAIEGIATAKANAEKNLQNVHELFESFLDSALDRHSNGYRETTLGDEVDLLPGYAFPSGGYTERNSDVRLLRGDNIMQGYFRWEDVKRWPSHDTTPYAKFSLQEGDVILAMDRPWVKAGLKRAQICAEDLPCLLVQRTSRLRCRSGLRRDFLYHLTGSLRFSQHLLGLQTGIGVPHISGKQIESFRFMRPPLQEQESIADTLNKLNEKTSNLIDIYQQKMTAFDDLKKSLLHSAFSGTL